MNAIITSGFFDLGN